MLSNSLSENFLYHKSSHYQNSCGQFWINPTLSLLFLLALVEVKVKRCNSVWSCLLHSTFVFIIPFIFCFLNFFRLIFVCVISWNLVVAFVISLFILYTAYFQLSSNFILHASVFIHILYIITYLTLFIIIILSINLLIFILCLGSTSAFECCHREKVVLNLFRLVFSLKGENFEYTL